MSANQRGDDSRSSTPECLFALEPQQIKIGREIGKGAFSVVYAGELGKKRVAVKCQPKDADGQIPPYVLKEVQILQKLQHPQLLEFIGACDHRKAKQVWILSEHSNNGDIDLLLRAIRRGALPHVGWRRMALIALDAAMGVAFLHSQQVIHRDIKSSNILLDDQYHAKLCDFGFAMDMKTTKQRDAEDETLGKARRKSYCGTDAYMAPEMFLDEDYNESVDVFSFGVVLMELLCCRVANQDGFLMRLPQHKFRVCVPEFHAALPESCPPAFARLAEQCVSFEPSERPSADAVVSALRDLVAQKQLMDAADKSSCGNSSAVVELRAFTPMVKADVRDECEPQMEDDDDDNYSDEEDDDEDEDDEDSCGDECGGGGGDDTVDLESDESDHSGVFSSEDVAHLFSEDCTEAFDAVGRSSNLQEELELKLEFRPDERPLPTLPPPYHAGVILKRNRRGTRAWSSKWFILDGDQLQYSDNVPSFATDIDSKRRSDSTVSTCSTQSGGASTLSTLALRDCRIWKTMEMPELCFNIINGSWKIKRELQAQSQDELELWMALINQAIDYANDSAAAAAGSVTGDHKGSSSSSVRDLTQVAKPPRSGKQYETRCPESAAEATASKEPPHTAGSKDSHQQQEGDDNGSSSRDTADATAEDEGDDVFQWLKEIGLQRYTATFKAKGYASVDFIRETGIEKEDLNFLGIKDPAARKAITAASRVLRNED